jgi:large repetitive protein
MKHLVYTFLFLFGFSFSAKAQLADGTIAPDFTVTDINGNTHHLYGYLNSGIHVLLDFSATWCGPCWNYHNTHAMRDLYDNFGPNGTNQVMVIYLEGENNNSLQCLNGNGGACTGVYPNSSQGNWVAGTTYPIADLSTQGMNGLKAQYGIGYFPTIYAINHNDKKIYETGQASYAALQSMFFGSFQMAVSTTVNDVSPCPLTASITANVTAGAPPFTYAWSSNGGGGQTASNLATGNYSCVVTDNNGFTRTTTPVAITSTPVITTAMSGLTNIPCYGNSTGQVTVNANGGNGGFSYEWNNGQNTPTAVNLPPGSYTCTATDVMGCSKVAGPFNITQPSLLSAEANPINPSCGQTNGIIAILHAGGTGPYSFTLNGNTQQTPTFTNLPGGSYNFQVTDNNGCTSTGLTSLISSTPPVAVTAAVGAISCIATSATVSGAGSSTGSNMEYQWTTSNGTITSGANDVIATVSQGGTYQLAVRNVTNNCVTSSSVVMPANVELPVAIVANPTQLNCSTTNITLNGAGSSTGSNFSYLWTTTGGNITAGATTLMPNVNQAGAYNLKVTNAVNGCVKNIATTVASNTTAPTLSVPAALELNCAQSSAQLCATSDATSFAWSNGSTQNCTTAATAGTYTLTATGANGCTATAASVVTASTDIPVVSIASPATVTCTVPNITLQGSVAASGAYTYLWTTSNGTIVLGETAANAVVSAAGVYNLRATNTASGCVGNQVVTVNQLSAAPSAAYTGVQTDAQVTGTAQATAGSTTYNWLLDGTSVGTSSTVTVTLTTPGTYSLCLKATNDCGTNESCTSYTLLAPLALSINQTAITCFGANDGSLSAIAIGGKAPYTYSWTGPNGFTATTETISGVAPGEYICVITDSNNSTSTATSILTQPTAITVSSQTITDDTNSQSVGGVQLNMAGGTGAYTYLWSNNQATQNLTNVTAGSFTCEVTDAKGCKAVFGPFVVANLSSTDETKFVKVISVHPVPATTTLNVAISFKNVDNSSVSLVNQLGQIVLTKNYNGNQINDVIDVTNIPAGMYNLMIINGENKTARKVIVTK